MRLDFELLNCVDDGQNGPVAAEEKLVHDPIQQEQVRSVPLAINGRDPKRGARQCQRGVKTGTSRVALGGVDGRGAGG